MDHITCTGSCGVGELVEILPLVVNHADVLTRVGGAGLVGKTVEPTLRVWGCIYLLGKLGYETCLLRAYVTWKKEAGGQLSLKKPRHVWNIAKMHSVRFADTYTETDAYWDIAYLYQRFPQQLSWSMFSLNEAVISLELQGWHVSVVCYYRIRWAFQPTMKLKSRSYILALK